MIKQENFQIEGAGNKIILGDISFEGTQADKEVIVFVHGFKGFKDWAAHHLTAQYYAQRGYIFIKFNFSHSGVPVDKPIDVSNLNDFAHNTITKELFDLQQVLNFVQKRYSENVKINLIGHSRGGGVSIVNASVDHRINKLITWSAISDFSSLWKKEQEEAWLKEGEIFVVNARTKEQMPLNKVLLEDFKANEQDYNILSAAKKIEIPWLIIHGDEDVNVPFSVAENLHAVNSESNLIKIVSANHVYGASHPYKESVLPPALLKVCEVGYSFLES